MTAHSPVTTRCREISDADLGSIAELLNNGFPNRSRAYWLGVFDRLKKHSAPADMPKYGYLVERAGAPVGAILPISTMMPDGNAFTRCNHSSWYLEPRFRTYAPMLSSQAIRKKSVTYYNLTPAVHTLPILEAQGYRDSPTANLSPPYSLPSAGARSQPVLSSTRLTPMHTMNLSSETCFRRIRNGDA